MTSAPRPEWIQLWDPLLRGFHWLLAFFVITAWGLGEFGPDVMTLHFWCGYAVIALLVVRLLWGLLGPRPARFSAFVRGPGAIVEYARHLFERRPSYWPGHNPLGALSVLAMLTALAVQVSSGLISDPEDYVNVGPLADQVDSATSTAAVGWHHTGALVILVLVLLHIGVIVFYRFWKHEDLIAPMIHGRKLVVHRDND